MCGGMSTKVVQEPEGQVVCSVVASKSPRDPRGTVPRPEPGTVLVRTFRSTCKIMHSYGSVCFAHSGECQVCLSGGVALRICIAKNPPIVENHFLPAAGDENFGSQCAELSVPSNVHFMCQCFDF